MELGIGPVPRTLDPIFVPQWSLCRKCGAPDSLVPQLICSTPRKKALIRHIALMEPTALKAARSRSRVSHVPHRFIMSETLQIPQTSLWANKKCLLICSIVSIANMQYGLDSAAVGGLQAMPGFLVVFGYPDPTAAGGYAIEVSLTRKANATRAHITPPGYFPATDQQPLDAWILPLLPCCWSLCAFLRPQSSPLDRMCAECNCLHHSNSFGEQGSHLRGTSNSGLCKWLPRYIFQRVHVRGLSSTFACCHGCPVCLLVRRNFFFFFHLPFQLPGCSHSHIPHVKRLQGLLH